MQNILKKQLSDFKKSGFIYLRNFLTKEEVNLINIYRKDIINNSSKNLYSIKKNRLSKLNCKHFLKDIMLVILVNKSEINFKSFDDLKNYLIEKKIISEDFKEFNKYLEFELHVAFSNINATNYAYESDILLNNVISKIFLKNDLLKIYQELLNSQKLLYWGESGFTYNKPPVRGWHSDDPINTQYKTNDETFQIRVAIYPDSTPNQSGGLKILPNSHKYNNPVQALKNYIKYFILRNESYKNTYKSINLLQFQKNIFPSSGDIIIWDKRLMHSPWAQMIKFLNFGFLSPNMENYLSKKFFVLPSFPRSILTFDIGRKSKNLDTYINKWISIRQDYKEYWDSREKFKKKEFIEFLKKKSIEFFDIKNKKNGF